MGNRADHREPVGIIPAAGTASRISPLPCSKEIYPIGFPQTSGAAPSAPEVACGWLLRSMKTAGVQTANVILRPGKWDIPAHLKNGGAFGMNLSYLIMTRPYGVAYTVDTAYPFIGERPVVFGFPDILFEPQSALSAMLTRFHAAKSDIVLGLFSATTPEKMDMVALNAHGNVTEIDIKPTRTALKYTWILSVWGHRFSEFLHQRVAAHHRTLTPSQKEKWDGKGELHLGVVFQEALAAGFRVDHLTFEQGTYVDIGTPDDLKKAVLRYNTPHRNC